MTPRAQAETIRAALRRSRPLILILVVSGLVLYAALKQLQGPTWASESNVLLTTTDIGTVITESQPIIDRDRVDEMGLAFAESAELYERVARRQPTLGTPRTLAAATTPSVQDSVLRFSVEANDERRAVRIANALAREYVAWREELEGAAIVDAITQLRAQIEQEPPTSERRQDFRTQLNELEVLNQLNTGHARVLETAARADKTSPAPLRDALIGAVLGLLVALVVTAAREAIDTRVRSEDDIEDILDVPVLATVQSLPRRTQLVMFGRHERFFGDTYGLLAASLMPGKASGPTTIAITSSIASEGKTTTAANLAVALARRGEDVVLADFDVRKPALGRLFRLPAEAPGVAQLIEQRTTLEQALWEVSLNGQGPNMTATTGLETNGAGSSLPRPGSLKILPAGGSIDSPSHVRRLSSVIDQLKQSAGVVVLDTPPALLTVEMAELARSIDRVVVVVRQGRATRRSLRALSRQAQSWPAEFVGAVLTDAPVEEQMYYYGTR